MPTKKNLVRLAFREFLSQLFLILWSYIVNIDNIGRTVWKICINTIYELYRLLLPKVAGIDNKNRYRFMCHSSEGHSCFDVDTTSRNNVINIPLRVSPKLSVIYGNWPNLPWCFFFLVPIKSTVITSNISSSRSKDI